MCTPRLANHLRQHHTEKGFKSTAKKWKFKWKFKTITSICALRAPRWRRSMDKSHCSPICSPPFKLCTAGKDHYAIAKHLISQPLDTTTDHALLLWCLQGKLQEENTFCDCLQAHWDSPAGWRQQRWAASPTCLEPRVRTPPGSQRRQKIEHLHRYLSSAPAAAIQWMLISLTPGASRLLLTSQGGHISSGEHQKVISTHMCPAQPTLWMITASWEY